MLFFPLKKEHPLEIIKKLGRSGLTTISSGEATTDNCHFKLAYMQRANFVGFV